MSCELSLWQLVHGRLSASIARFRVSLLRGVLWASTVSTIVVLPASCARRTSCVVTAQSSVGYSCCQGVAPAAEYTSRSGVVEPEDSISWVERAFAAAATARSASGWNAPIEPTADRYRGLGQRAPNTVRDRSRWLKSAKRRARIS